MNTIVTLVLMTLQPSAASLPSSPEAHARAEFQKYASQLVGKSAAIDAEGVCTVAGRGSGLVGEHGVEARRPRK